MKIISVGDLHGRDVAEDVRDLINQCDKMVFMGDYVDSFERTDGQIRECLRNVIQLKRDNPEKVVLLWGNHDVQYLLGPKNHGCSGYRPQMHTDLFAEFHCNKELFQLAFQHNDWVWTHAGIHDGWWLFRLKEYQGFGSVADELNFAFKEGKESIFDVGHRRGGYRDVGGPLWCDRNELINAPLKDYNQVVGHTKRDFVEKFNYKNHEIVFVDVLHNEDDFVCYTSTF
jgi:predicted MPP superfamily phosphohydrolase